MKLQPGTDTDIQISPSFTTTDDDAISGFDPVDRGCYACDEINMMFIPYNEYDPTYCNQVGYRYSMSNCVFESAFEATLKNCDCYPIFHQEDYQSIIASNDTPPHIRR